jgi:hypothetical protein
MGAGFLRTKWTWSQWLASQLEELPTLELTLTELFSSKNNTQELILTLLVNIREHLTIS